jgi:drug/metabolite transporter (DMT)-like permease
MMNFNKPWFLYGIFALVIVCIVDLGKKYILDKENIHPDELVIYMSITVGIIASIHLLMDKTCRNPLKCKPKILLYVFVVTMFLHFFNIAFTRSTKLASDVTLPAIMVSLSIIFIYLFSSLFFDSSPKFDIKILSGVVLVVIGLCIICKYFKD